MTNRTFAVHVVPADGQLRGSVPDLDVQATAPDRKLLSGALLNEIAAAHGFDELAAFTLEYSDPEDAWTEHVRTISGRYAYVITPPEGPDAQAVADLKAAVTSLEGRVDVLTAHNAWSSAAARVTGAGPEAVFRALDGTSQAGRMWESASRALSSGGRRAAAVLHQHPSVAKLDEPHGRLDALRRNVTAKKVAIVGLAGLPIAAVIVRKALRKPPAPAS